MKASASALENVDGGDALEHSSLRCERHCRAFMLLREVSQGENPVHFGQVTATLSWCRFSRLV